MTIDSMQFSEWRAANDSRLASAHYQFELVRQCCIERIAYDFATYRNELYGNQYSVEDLVSVSRRNDSKRVYDQRIRHRGITPPYRRQRAAGGSVGEVAAMPKGAA